MKIKVLRIISDNIIEFSSKKGNGIGTWNHRTDRPEEGREYAAEFDINLILRIGDNAQKLSAANFSIAHDSSLNKLEGAIEQVDEDGIIFFRLSIDCLIMIECEDEKIKKGDWLRITIGPEIFIVHPWGF